MKETIKKRLNAMLEAAQVRGCIGLLVIKVSESRARINNLGKYECDFCVSKFCSMLWSCTAILIVVNGGYGDWKAAGACSKSCGGGEQLFTRQCDNPKPANGGANCSSIGPDSEIRECNIQPCPSMMSLVVV